MKNINQKSLKTKKPEMNQSKDRWSDRTCLHTKPGATLSLPSCNHSSQQGVLPPPPHHPAGWAAHLECG